MAEVLVIGEGGREDALRGALESSNEVGRVVVAGDIETGLRRFGRYTKPFVVVGPEAPLIEGLADALRTEGYVVFGAGRRAAKYEASKWFAAEMMRRSGIPSPPTFMSLTNLEDLHYIRNHDADSYVIKADGVAGGKGVVLPSDQGEAWAATQEMRYGTTYGNAGRRIINFQERHSGPEVSAMAVVGDNDQFTLLPLSQDHKRLQDGDKGPNTGGMGAYAPLPESIVSATQQEQIRELVEQSLAGMRANGVPFERGLLYVGAMLSEQMGNKPAVIEYNVRFGDPETQVLMPLLLAAGVDVYRLLRSAAEGSLETPNINFANLALSALTVCLAAAGYPASPHGGEDIYGLDQMYSGVTVQQAAVKDGKTDGGRVLYVTGVGDTLKVAASKAYAAIDVDLRGPDSAKIGFAGMQLRRDIGAQAMSGAV